jgi:hypothetical protein
MMPRQEFAGIGVWSAVEFTAGTLSPSEAVSWKTQMHGKQRK